ncbi:MAG: hypothetical protein KF825_12075 [Ferruginibacter sp.]|nr:hypothetical protein [Ferruginibacter sp.]
MRKLILLLMMIFILCISSFKVNKLQACDANMAMCGVVNTSTTELKTTVKKIQVEYTSEIDMPLNALMNPFIPM